MKTRWSGTYEFGFGKILNFELNKKNSMAVTPIFSLYADWPIGEKGHC